MFAFLHSDDTLHLEEALNNVKKALSIYKSSNSYKILGDIFLNMEKYDSAYVAFQNAYQIDTAMGYVYFGTADGLFKSAIKSDNPEKLRNVIQVLDKYLEQGIAKYDSLWTYISQAEVSRKQSKFEVALDYVKQALALNANSEAALEVLDSLYFMDSFEQALKLKISTLEENVKENGTLFQFLTLADAYVQIKSYDKSFEAIDSAFQISTTKEDTAWIYGIKSFIFYQQGLDAYSEEDTVFGRINMEKTIQYANETINVYPKWPLTLNILQVIHHEYIIDYEKSYKVSQELLLLDSLNTDYITNAIEACLTSGRSDLAYKKADAILSSDTLGKQPLELEKKLAMKFILMTSMVLKGNRTEAFSEFGDFERHYKKRTERKEDWWHYRGTERFLRENKKIHPSFRDLLLKMIEALNSEKKKGLSILKKVEAAWKNLITEIK